MIQEKFDESALRARMEKRLRRDLDDLVWARLVKNRWVEEALQGEGNSDSNWLETFEEAVRAEEEVARRYRSSRDSQDAIRKVERGEPDDNRLRAWKEITALDASRRDYVIAFRRRVLRGKLIKWTRIALWIRRKAASQGKPTLYTKLELASDRTPIIPEPGLMNWFKDPLAYMDPESETLCHQEINAHSVLGDLKQVATRLQRTYGWSEADSVGFVLSGQVPLGMMRRYSWQRNLAPQLSRVIIDVPADTPDRVVSKMYRAARKELPATGRAMKKIHTDLAVFIAEVNDGSSWREALAEYNRRFSLKRYGDNIRKFQREASAAYGRVANVKLRWEGRSRGARPFKAGGNRTRRVAP